ncbi:DUF5979 domain-containing protein [Isoptericola sp. BMS4]|uniref:DUF5979 domain-containing protein n=1 Tax=Isoptericola sp. BMS4 TaxID=2527875 RepID=UPI00142218A3|nr:DUF5979 domain-containing protein [Isoptericola sp. BMS4]
MLGAAALALPMVMVPATTASAADWQIQKAEISSGPYQPGQNVQWVVTVSCSDPNADPCAPVTMTDPLPDELELVSAVIQSTGAGTQNPAVDANTDTDTVTFTADNLNNGQQAQVLITAQVPEDAPYSDDGTTYTNTATVVSDNAAEASTSDDIDIVVPLVLDSQTTKTIDPEGAIASPGTPATMTIGSTNTSNDPVDTMVITEPTEGTDPNPFTYLGFTGWGDVSWPAGATQADVTFTCADGSTPTITSTDADTLPGPPGGCEVEGFTVEFSGAIESGASASIPVEVEQTDAVTELTEVTTVANETSSYVTHADADPSDPTTADDTYVITPPNNAVTASKSFDPDMVSAGSPTTVTIGATNDGDPTTSLSITEPSPGTDSPFEGDDPLTFTGWGTAGDPGVVQWPAGADAASVTYTCADGSTPEVAAEAPDTLPDPPGGCDVVGFTVTFTGDIATGAEASLPFQAGTDPDQDEDDVLHPNEITADIPNASGTAEDTLETLTDRLATDTTKSISPSEIPALPGQTVVVGLPTELLPFGEEGSTTNADQLVVQDPTDPSDPGAFWDSFTASSVRSTEVPAGTALTINYWDGSEWVEAPDCGSPVQGAATVNCSLPDGAEGVQFVYDDTSGSGIPPGTSVSPNFVAAYTGPEDADDPIENCGASSASSGSVAPTDPAEGCATVDPFPVPTNPGDLNFIAKEFLAPDGQSGTPYTVRARTQDEITAQITWSTNGFENVDPMVISDVADPVAADDPAIADSYYDAFDLVEVAVDDPLLQYDQIESVELYIDGAWVEASGDPCPCDGAFPGYTLTADEQEGATSVRLTYTESPSRAEFPADPTEPAAGEGVARSTQSAGRHVDLTFRLRDDRRSGGPALGREQGEMYNTGDPGLVNDTARGTATFTPPDGSEPVIRTDTADDDVLIIDEPINVGITKEWTGGPLSVPPEGTPDSAYPSTHAVITATNNSVARVDQLRITEPSSPGDIDPVLDPGTSPFDVFDVTHIDITPPEGATGTVVIVHEADGNLFPTSEAGVESLTAAELADVVGVDVQFNGRVVSQGEGVLDLTLRLRELDRYTGERITVDPYSPVPNSAGAQVSDPGGTTESTPEAWDGADMELQDAAISMNQTKSFDPATIVEPGSDAEANPTSTLTITGQPTGPSRAVEMTLTDVDGSFWNQYDLLGLDASTLTAPIDRVQVDACTGGTYEEASDTFAGCTWTDGTPSTTFALPDGVDPAAVVGLRFTFTRADGAIWENPANPTQAVNLEVRVRDTLRSDPGTPVASDLAQNDPAPGEDAPGVATNDVTSTVTGADLVFNPDDPENPTPVTSDAAASGTIVYQHTENGVEVVKDFAGVPSGGTQEPSAAFPMSIAVTNTGNRPIYDLDVIDDPMPTDDDGPQLRLAPDADPQFSYALSGAAPDPANGDPLPTTDAGTEGDVVVDRSGDLAGLEFTFPEGSVLEVGQTYTITVMVQFRVGLPANTLVENTVGVTGDRPWDDCAQRLDDETGQCQADADVTPIPAATLAQSKFVKATDDDQLEVFPAPEAGVDPDTECTPNAAGFYAYPCTPVIEPGHDETWRIRVDNVGNLPITKVVVYDRLPTPGDTASDPRSSSERGSQWTPIPDPANPPELVNAPPSARTTFYYTLVDDFCADDLADPLGEPVCSDDPETGGWAELTTDLDDATFARITAIKAVVDMSIETPFRPGQFIALDGTTTTPPEAPDAGDRSIAWNSAAVNGVGVAPNGQTFNMVSTEGTKVGVAAATGPLEVDKLVTGDGAEQYAPDSFEVQVQCTSAVGTWVETELDPITVTVTPGEPTVVPNLPYGAECTLTEDASVNGQTSFTVTPETVVVPDDETDPAQIEITNEYDLGSLELAKTVESNAVDQDGNPVTYGPFEATVECTFLGEEVFADGYDAGNPMVVELAADGTPVTLTGLPVNAECAVTETGTGGAASTTVTVTQPGEDPVTTDGTSADVVVVPDEDGTAATEIGLTNVFDVGAIHLLKEIAGDGGEAFGDGPFEFAIQCTLDDDGDGPGEPRTVYDGTVTLTDDALEATVENLPAGAVCDITETDTSGAQSTVIDPNPVTVGADETAEVTATNTYDLGSVVVDKVVTGDAADFGTGPFEVTLECTYEDEPVDIPGGAVRELTPGEPVTYDGLPVGADCVVTETGDGGATSTTVSTTVDGGEPGQVVVGEDPGEVTVTNTFDAGSITVDKAVDGAGAAFAQGPYEVTLACTFDGDDIEIPGGATREITDGGSVTYDGLPIGAECAVTESDPNQATSVSIEPESVTVGGDDGIETTVEVDVTNTYDVGGFTVEKVVEGDGAGFGTGPFEVSAACTFEGADVEIPGGATRTIEPGASVIYVGLPVGADCVVTETDDFGATDVEVSTAVDGGEPGEVIVPATGTGPVTVTVTNTYDVGSIEVDKELEGLGSVVYRPGPFEATVECTFPGGPDGEPIEIPGGATRQFMPDDPAVYDGLPVGAECTVTETDDFGATETTMTVEGGEPVEGTSAEVVVPPNDGGDPATVTVTATNTFRTSPLLVRKTVDGDGAGFAPDMPEPPYTVDSLDEIPYEVTLECTFDGQEIPIPGGATRKFGPGFPAAYFALPDGAECVVTETDDGGATSLTVEPGTVTIAEDEQAVVDVTNTYDLGGFTVEKVVDGEGAQYGTGPYEVSAECIFQGEPIDMEAEGIGGATRTVAPGEPAVYEGLPVGADCVVTETDAGGATSSTISTTVDGGEPGQVVVPTADADPATVTVTNTFDVGAVVVDKEVVFEGVAYETGPFEVTLACTFSGEPIDVPGGATREIAAGGTVTYDGLPVGAECVVAETDDGGAVASTVSTAVDGGEPGEVVVPAAGADAVTVTVTNTFPTEPPAPPAPPAPGPDDGGFLPTTGAGLIGLLVVVAAVLLIGGGLLYRFGTRRSR